MAGIDFSSFFGGASTNMFSDYAAIRNGSYKRLLKQYYSDAGSTSYGSKGTTKTSNVLDRILEERRRPVESKSVSEANSALTTGVNSTKNALNVLQNDDTYKSDDKKTASDKTLSALKNYVSAYNSTIEAAKKSTNTGMTHHVADIMKAMDQNAEALEKTGIYIKSDGTLYINEGKAKNADKDETKALFSKERGSLGYSIGNALNGAGYYATSSASTQQSDTKNDTTANTSQNTASVYGNLKNNIDALKTGEYDSEGAVSLVADLTKNYNSLIGTARLSTNEGVAANLKNLLNRTSDNKKALSDIGISVDKNGNLSYDEKKLKASDIDDIKKTLKSYATSIETSASLVKYYATTNAGSSSGYNANGSYNPLGTNTTYTSPFQA